MRLAPHSTPVLIFPLLVQFFSLLLSSPVFSALSLALTRGAASGDVTAHTAIIWARANQEAYLRVAYDSDQNFLQPQTAPSVLVTEESDYTGQVILTGLQPSTRYHYRVWLTAEPAGNQRERPATMQGSFTTAPDGKSPEPVAFVFGGDVGGQGLCRHQHTGYAIFTQMAALRPDFFVANGDMIYADNACPPERPFGPLGPRGLEANALRGSPPPVGKNIPGRFPSVLSPIWTGPTSTSSGASIACIGNTTGPILPCNTSSSTCPCMHSGTIMKC